ncbi:MAG: molecular chaperone HtpG [Eubacteriales bacterium]|nr:molecular chaperone HtpG [Eubacteriales bacterium]
MEKGGISVQTENIFPVIKRWLYSDKDIFLREVISNACDAISKHKRLISLGNAADEESDYKITVTADKEAKKLKISDNGIGMNAEEVKKYINQIALSGALDFIDKYESKEGNTSGIIGHFGLGFYSVFMVSEQAEIVTKSYDGSPAVCWSCDENGSYEMDECVRDAGRGTDVILHISEDETGYLDSEKLKEILRKYCSFMPYPVYFTQDDKTEQINDTNPLWQKNPKDITSDDYKEFYKKLTGDYEDPLMYVHINADYPLNFKGILYFPKIKSDFETPEPKVSLYYNQVFVSDNIREVLPEFLINVRGVLDCPELPLNVSRSYLQTNTYVAKVSRHISKKVADRYNYIFTNEREELEKVYESLSVFTEYGCMRDERFYDKIKDILLLKKTDGSFVTVGEYLDNKDEGVIYYTSDKQAHSYYVSVYNSKGIDVIEASRLVDTQFLQFIERKNEKIKFRRIDSALDALGEKSEEDGELKHLFVSVSGKKDESVRFAAFGEENAPALITVDEESRRFGDMMKMYGMKDNLHNSEEILTVNTASKALLRIKRLPEEIQKLAAKQIYMSALLLSRPFTKEETQDYVKLNSDILELLPVSDEAVND